MKQLEKIAKMNIKQLKEFIKANRPKGQFRLYPIAKQTKNELRNTAQKLIEKEKFIGKIDRSKNDMQSYVLQSLDLHTKKFKNILDQQLQNYPTKKDVEQHQGITLDKLNEIINRYLSGYLKKADIDIVKKNIRQSIVKADKITYNKIMNELSTLFDNKIDKKDFKKLTNEIYKVMEMSIDELDVNKVDKKDFLKTVDKIYKDIEMSVDDIDNNGIDKKDFKKSINELYKAIEMSVDEVDGKLNKNYAQLVTDINEMYNVLKQKINKKHDVKKTNETISKITPVLNTNTKDIYQLNQDVKELNKNMKELYNQDIEKKFYHLLKTLNINRQQFDRDYGKSHRVLSYAQIANK